MYDTTSKLIIGVPLAAMLDWQSKSMILYRDQQKTAKQYFYQPAIPIAHERKITGSLSHKVFSKPCCAMILGTTTAQLQLCCCNQALILRFSRKT